MPSSWDVVPFGLVISDVSEEHVTPVFRVEIISELRTTLAVTRKRNYTVKKH
jgi:hypothetical protein